MSIQWNMQWLKTFIFNNWTIFCSLPKLLKCLADLEYGRVNHRKWKCLHKTLFSLIVWIVIYFWWTQWLKVVIYSISQMLPQFSNYKFHCYLHVLGTQYEQCQSLQVYCICLHLNSSSPFSSIISILISST